jgi:hypothetical protein
MPREHRQIYCLVKWSLCGEAKSPSPCQQNSHLLWYRRFIIMYTGTITKFNLEPHELNSHCSSLGSILHYSPIHVYLLEAVSTSLGLPIRISYIYSSTDVQYKTPNHEAHFGVICLRHFDRPAFSLVGQNIFPIVLFLFDNLRSYLEQTVATPGLENRSYDRRDSLRWPCYTLYPLKLALASLTGGDRSIGIVH